MGTLDQQAVLGFNGFQDRFAVNIFGDACCAVIVARLDGEKTNLAIEGDEATL